MRFHNPRRRQNSALSDDRGACGGRTDAVLLAEQIKRLDGFFGEADIASGTSRWATGEF
jgi:hypothetical protein